MKTVLCGLLLAWVTTGGWAAAARVQPRLSDLTELSLEELMNIEVTSVSKKTEKLSKAAAAIFVITQEDIRRAGATSIAEALRLAPGLEVARVDAHTWAISARGFNDVFANKLLVLLDGRSIYTPLFSGVFWDQQDTLLEDIERIEVIRGPGATLWGANAVNGVINIITKRARDTQGGLLTAGGGSEERGFGSVRYGGTLGADAHFRVYAKYVNRDGSGLPDGHAANDAWQLGQGGFRLDWLPAQPHLLTLQGDLYGGNLAQTFFVGALLPPFQQVMPDHLATRGGNLLGRWSHTLASASEMRLQVYYDRTIRDTAIFKEDRHNVDLDFQHRFPLGGRHDIVWGLGYRLSSDNEGNTFTVSLTPASRTTHLVSAFAQDEIVLVADRLHVTLGSKFEHNTFTGFEIQPGARLLWTPSDRHTVWAAIARAVRTPSRAEDAVRINQQVLPPGTLFPGAPAAVVSFAGDRGIDSEKLLAYELGYRVQPHEWLSLDLALFYNVYNNLRSIEPGTPFPETSPFPPHLVVPFLAANKLNGETYGAELVANWQLTEWWRLRALYSYLHINLSREKGSRDTISQAAQGNSPQQQLALRSAMDLPWRLAFDLALRYVDRLPNLHVGSYTVLDVRLGWRPTQSLELAIVGHNLLEKHHPEFSPSTFINTQPTEVQHSVYGKMTWRF